MRSQVNVNAFLDFWPEMSEKLNTVLNKYYPRQQFKTLWPKEIEDFLILLRLLPFKPGCRSLSSPETFQNSIKRLLVFSKVK